MEDEIIHQVIIGMGRLELSEEYFPSPILRPEVTSSLQSPPGMVDPAVVFTSPLNSTFPTSLDMIPGQTIPEIFTGPLSPPLLDLPPSVLSDPSLVKTASLDVPVSVTSNPFEPWPEINLQSNNATIDGSVTSTGKDEHQTEKEEISQDSERAAIGRLSSMSLIATVTAHGEL